MRTAYAGGRRDAEVMKVDRRRNTYVNHPNKSQEILRKKAIPQSKILAQASDPRIPHAITGLKGTLQTQMENIRPFNSAAPSQKQARGKGRQAKPGQRWQGNMVYPALEPKSKIQSAMRGPNRRGLEWVAADNIKNQDLASSGREPGAH